MVFNSFGFLIFFATFFVLYFFVFNKSLKKQNILLLLGSYFFYACADWRFLLYIIAISIFNYFLGIYIEKENKYKRLLLYLGVFQGIASLVFFKYFNFFISSFNVVFHSLNENINLQTLHIIVPLGISFYTFRTISYVVDVNKAKIKATKDWLVFFNYVSFFPTLLSGPIDKAKMFFPQLEKKRDFNYLQATDALRQILWGLFKKLVIADNCAGVTTQIFESNHIMPGSTLLLGAFLYAFQIYADFSGYSDMAIGVSRLIGFNISKNFDFPFFSQNIAEFWRKWHISLTTWLTEYVFTPLSIAFRDFGTGGLILAIIINFTLCGIWHGPNWTYVLFGFLHGCYFIPLILKGSMNKKKTILKNKRLPSFREFTNILMTFTLVMFTFIVFRADTITKAFDDISRILSASVFSYPQYIERGRSLTILILLAFFILMEWMGREGHYAISDLGMRWSRPRRWLFYFVLIFLIGLFMHSEETAFIYFKF